MLSRSHTAWTVPWGHGSGQLTLKTGWRTREIAVLIDDAEVARLGSPTLELPLVTHVIPGSEPAIAVALVARPGGREASVFVDGIGVATRETLEAFQNRAPEPMADNVRWTYWPGFKIRYVLVPLTVFLAANFLATYGLTVDAAPIARYMAAGFAVCLDVWASIRLARWLAGRVPTLSGGGLFWITLFSFYAIWFSEAAIVSFWLVGHI